MTDIEQKKRNQILLVLFLGVLMGALDIAIVGPALPSIQSAFKVDERTGAWVFSIYVLFNLIGTPLMAKLSDLFGRRWVYLLDVALFGLGSLLVALSGNFTIFLAGRAIQGFGAGGIFPVASAVIGDTFPPEKRGGALGLIGAVFGLAFVIGPILGGIILVPSLHLGWPWLFLINLPLALVVIWMAARLLPATRAANPGRIDWPGMLALSVSLASLAYGINQIDSTRLPGSLVSANVWPFLLAAVVFLVAFLLIERQAPSPVVRLDLFKSRQMVLAYVLSAGAGLGESGLVFLPTLAVAALGVSKSAASYLLMPVVLALGFGSPMVGRLLDRLGSRVVIISGTFTLALGMVLLGSFASNMAMFIISGLLIGLGLSALLGAPVRYIMLNETSTGDRSVAQGVLTLFTSTGQLMAGVLVGGIAASRGGGVSGYSSAYLFTGAVAVVLVLLSLALKSRAAELAKVRQVQQDAQASHSAETA
jgi:EmrB/QacA subfamily drug resistance transporter